MSSARLKPDIDAPQRHPALQAAIATRDAAREVVKKAGEAESRAEALLKTAERELARFDDLEQQILKYRTAHFERAARTDGPEPIPSKLPPDLLQKRAEKQEAVEQRDAAQTALDQLSADLEAAERKMSQAQGIVTARANDVMVAEGVRQVAEVRAAWRKVWALFDQLSAFPATLPPDCVGMLQALAAQDHRQFPGNRNNGLAEAGQCWRSWRDALCQDADAEMPDFEDGDTVKKERVA